MSAPATAPRWVLGFAEGSAAMRELLGNKGANLAEMLRVLGPERVPGGFTITTAACVEYMRGGDLGGLDEQVEAAVAELERASGKRFGDPRDPLLLSVRSGAPVSMPGMLDTVLNLGLSEEATRGLAEIASPHVAWDSRRRLVQMYSEVVRGAPPEAFEEALAAARAEAGVEFDSALPAAALERLATRFTEIHAAHTGEPFPEEPLGQLREAVRAVFDSWRNERAVTYRRLNAIPDDLGTAVTVQRMVFGNMDDSSGSGVAFTRDPTTGERRPEGDFLVNAQGEDVVAGVRNTETLDGLRRRMPEVHAELLDCLERLERHYRDIQDVEYTIERGRLYILQTRSAKRHARAAIRFAVEASEEGVISRKEALRAVDPGSLGSLFVPAFAPGAEFEELTRGVGASPGAAKGEIALTATAAEERAATGADVILVRPFTSADDVGGFDAARGILTSQGGKSSHAAIVARGMGRPCVCGATEVRVDAARGEVRIGERTLRAGERIAIDGESGAVTADDVPLVRPEVGDDVRRVLAWADEFRRLGVRANADTAEDAARARALGAEGIGLCRTEHMFFGADREQLVREMFIAGAEARSSDDTASWAAYRDSLERLGELQEGDFAAILGAMEGLPVTIRLLDPPLHEFIPVAGFERELEVAMAHGGGDEVERARRRLELARELEEVNPMLGTRGARLAIVLEGLYEMQASAIARAAARLAGDGPPRVEIMLPLIAFESELAGLRAAVEGAVRAELERAGATLDVPIGTMIELPRACLRAKELARDADFFSFGTNDLTQTTLGLSRDDAERGFLPEYLARRLLDRSPFESIDVDGVGELVRLAVTRARAARPRIKLGVCGEHGGDPASVEFFDRAGLDYVSCSPLRIPAARLAAARAAIG